MALASQPTADGPRCRWTTSRDALGVDTAVGRALRRGALQDGPSRLLAPGSTRLRDLLLPAPDEAVLLHRIRPG